MKISAWVILFWFRFSAFLFFFSIQFNLSEIFFPVLFPFYSFVWSYLCPSGFLFFSFFFSCLFVCLFVSETESKSVYFTSKFLLLSMWCLFGCRDIFIRFPLYQTHRTCIRYSRENQTANHIVKKEENCRHTHKTSKDNSRIEKTQRQNWN